MVRWFWLGCLISALTATASAEEYVLRLDAIGYIDRPATEIAPSRKILRTIEVIARPNVPFRAKAQFGKETVTFSGQLELSQGKDFRATVRYHYAFDTGDTFRNEQNEIVPLCEENSFGTQLALQVGDSVIAGGTGSKSEKLKSEIRYVLLLDKYQPAESER